MRSIEVETFLKSMGEGITRPALVIGDDYKEYILKNETVDEDGTLVNYNCMFINELLAFQIGKYLEVPIPEAVVAIVTKDSVENDPTIRFTYRFEEGKFFATKRLEKVENNILKNYQELRIMNKPYLDRPWKKFFKDIENKDDVSKIIAMDILIANFDRYINTGNILIDNCSRRRIYAIDHGHSFFGPVWDENKINCLSIKEITKEYIFSYANAILKEVRRRAAFGSGTVFGALEEHVNIENLDKHSFSDVILKIRSINETMIREWCNNIPNEWYIDKEVQITYYTNFLMHQKVAVEHIIQVLADQEAFTNYRGGKLKYGDCKEENCI